MFRTALRNVLAHKARLLMTVLAVMLGVAFVSGTLVFTNTISDAFQKSSAKGFDRVDVAVTADYQDSEGDRVGKVHDLNRAAARQERAGARCRVRRSGSCRASPPSPTRTAS